MSGAERLYRILLRLYPASFRREYHEPMQQAFRDQLRDAGTRCKRRRLWIRTGVDLLLSVPALSVRTFADGAFFFGAAMFLGRFELHSDDTGIEVFFILLFTSILGCRHPKHAWMGALLALSVPAAELVWGQARLGLNHTTGLALLAGFVSVVGIAGSYFGALVRKHVIGTGLS